MRTPIWIAVVLVSGCGSAEGMMADTDGSSGTDASSGSGDSTGATTTATTTTASTSASTTTGPTSGSTTTTSTDPDTSTTVDPETESTGGCPPGTLDCPCDIGSTCEGELLCENGVCVAEPSCEEPEGEPNDDEPSAVMLAEATCGSNAIDAAGAFDGAESDWFVFLASDAFLCTVGPSIEVEAEIDVAACAFVSCLAGSPNVACQGGSDAIDSPEGLPGCCDQNGVDLAFNCTLGAPVADIFVQLTSTEDACTPYDFTYAN